MKRVARVAASTIALVATAHVVAAQTGSDCKALLKDGVYDIQTKVYNYKTARALAMQYCDQWEQSGGTSTGGQLSIPGTPADAGYAQTSVSRSWKSFCGALATLNESQLAWSSTLKTANDQLAQKFVACTNRRGFFAWAESTEVPTEFFIMYKYNAMDYGQPPRISDFGVSDGVTCPIKRGEPLNIQSGFLCKRPSGDPVNVQLTMANGMAVEDNFGSLRVPRGYVKVMRDQPALNVGLHGPDYNPLLIHGPGSIGFPIQNLGTGKIVVHARFEKPDVAERMGFSASDPVSVEYEKPSRLTVTWSPTPDARTKTCVKVFIESANLPKRQWDSPNICGLIR